MRSRHSFQNLMRHGVFVLSLLGMLAPASAWGDLDHWTWRNPLPSGDPLRAVAWGHGQFVAIGNNGVLRSSADGITWASGNSGTEASLFGIVWGGEQFAAVGSGGAILTSPDGVTWTSRTSGTTKDLMGICWGGGQFIALGCDGIILTSSDGITWISRESGTKNILTSAVWHDNKYVVAGMQSTLLTSSDGITWATSPFNERASLYSISWGGGQFVAVGAKTPMMGDQGVALTSKDGINWMSHNVAGMMLERRGFLSGITWTGSQFVATELQGGITTSPDGVAWTHQPFQGDRMLFGLAMGDNQMVAVGDANTLLTSGDGKTWTNRTTSYGDIIRLVGREKKIIALTADGTFLTSVDGTSWNVQKSRDERVFNSIVVTDTQYVAVGPDGIFVSTDGQGWKFTGLGGYFRSLVWSGTQFVAVGNGGIIATSPDGLNWTNHGRDSGTNGDLMAVAWSGKLFVTAGTPDLTTVSFGQTGVQSAKTVLLTSPDGMRWIRQTVNRRVNFTKLIYGGDQFVAVASGGIVTSPDGITWTFQTINSGAMLADVAWTGRQYVAVGRNNNRSMNPVQVGEGVLVTSPDGITWTARKLGTVNALTSIIGQGSNVFVGGQGGTIMSASLNEAVKPGPSP